MRLYEYMFQMWRIDPYALCIRTFNHIWNMYSYNRIWGIVVHRFNTPFRCNFYRKDRCITPKWCVKLVYEKSEFTPKIQCDTPISIPTGKKNRNFKRNLDKIDHICWNQKKYPGKWNFLHKSSSRDKWNRKNKFSDSKIGRKWKLTILLMIKTPNHGK